MRKIETLVALVLMSALAGFFFRMGDRDATAAPPPPCDSYECKTLYAWYNSTYNLSAEDGTGAGTKTAVSPIYYPALTGEKSPWISDNTTYHLRRWTDRRTTCAQQFNQDPAPQEITPAGIKFTGNLDTPGQYHCTQGNP